MYTEYRRLGNDVIVYDNLEGIKILKGEEARLENMKKKNIQEFNQEILEETKEEYKDLLKQKDLGFKISIMLTNFFSCFMMLAASSASKITEFKSLGEFMLGTSLIYLSVGNGLYLKYKLERPKILANYKKTIAILEEKIKETEANELEPVELKEMGIVNVENEKEYLLALREYALGLKKKYFSKDILDDYENLKQKVYQK